MAKKAAYQITLSILFKVVPKPNSKDDLEYGQKITKQNTWYVMSNALLS